MKKKNAALSLSALLIASLFLSACGGAKNSASSAAGTETTAAAEEEDSSAADQLDVQLGPSPETIDPALNSAVDGGNMLIHLSEGLTKFDKDNNVIPGVAESWDVSEDGLHYTFHLRKGLKWSDGTALTAKDFVYSWKRVADPATAAPYAGDIMSYIAGYEEASKGDADALKVSAPDDDTFEVVLAGPCTFFAKLAAFATLVPVNEATIQANGDSWATKPESYISDGPYLLSEFKDGDRIVMKKNPNYWDKDNITFETIIWHLIENSNTAYTAFNEGSLDLIKDVPTEEIENLRGNDKFHIAPLMGTYYVSFNDQKEPFNNPKVREALSLAIDRNYVADTIMQGTYTAATNFVGPGVSDAADGSSFADVTKQKYGDFFNNEDYDANIERAKQLLAEAGYPEGQGFPAFDYLANDQSYHKAVAEYLQGAWAQLGITMNINIQEWKTVTADRRAGNFDVTRNGWVYDWDDPSNMLNLLISTSGNNDGKYSNPDFDALMKKAASETDADAHYEDLHEAEQILLKDYAMAPVAYYNEFWLQSDKLENTWHSPYGYWYLMYGTKTA